MSSEGGGAEDLGELSLETPRDGYVAPKAVALDDILASKDDEDEAMQRYKASLLGAAVAAGGAGGTDDPRKVVVTELSVLINGRDPLVFDLTDEANLKGGLVAVLKEGCEYKTAIKFRVQNEIVAGLRYKNVVSRGPMAVDRTDEMLGSYGPDPAKIISIVFPKHEWNKAPSGMTARATYSAKTRFQCDDKVRRAIRAHLRARGCAPAGPFLERTLLPAPPAGDPLRLRLQALHKEGLGLGARTAATAARHRRSSSQRSATGGN